MIQIVITSNGIVTCTSRSLIHCRRFLRCSHFQYNTIPQQRHAAPHKGLLFPHPPKLISMRKYSTDPTATNTTTNTNTNTDTTNAEKRSSKDIYENVILKNPALYDIFTARKFVHEDKIKQILNDNREEYALYLQSLFDEGKYKEIQSIFEKFGVNNPLQGEAPQIYLRSVFQENSITDKVNRLLVSTPGQSKSQPLYISIPQSRWWIVIYLIGLAISVGFLIVLFSAAKGGGLGGMLNTKYLPVDKSNTKITFADVMGNMEAKEDMQDLVEYLKNPERFANVKVPKGILLVGPPGTGKTLLARALAGEANVPFIVASGSEFEEVFVGLGARRIRQLFEEAKKQAPCIIFIDEIDAVAGSREKNFLRSTQMSLNQLLVELDGFNSREGIILIGATNMPQTLDPALVRPGRFDRKIFLRLPNATERLEILSYYLKKHKVADDVSPEIISKQLTGMSGADIENLVNWAAIETIKKDLPEIPMKQLELAILNIAMGREKKSLILSDNIKKIIAYHEGGHALTALFTPGAAEIRKATLVPRGEALGMVNFLADEDAMLLRTRTELFANMVTAMGGTAAERMIFGEENVTSGGSSDIQAATRIAKLMVTQLGMSEAVGHVHIEDNVNYFGQQEGLPAVVHDEIKRLVEEAYQSATNLLKEKEPELHKLASALLKYESLEKEEIMKVIKGEELSEKELKDEKEKQISEERKKIRESNEALLAKTKEEQKQRSINLKDKEEQDALDNLKKENKKN